MPQAYIFIIIAVLMASIGILIVVQGHKDRKLFVEAIRRKGLALNEQPKESDFPNAFDEWTTDKGNAFKRVKVAAGPTDGVVTMIRIKSEVEDFAVVKDVVVQWSATSTPQLCFLFPVKVAGMFRCTNLGVGTLVSTAAKTSDWWGAGVLHVPDAHRIQKREYIDLEKSAKNAKLGDINVMVMATGMSADEMLTRLSVQLKRLYTKAKGWPMVTIAGGYAFIELPRTSDHIKQLDELYAIAEEMRKVLSS